VADDRWRPGFAVRIAEASDSWPCSGTEL